MGKFMYKQDELSTADFKAIKSTTINYSEKDTDQQTKSDVEWIDYCPTVFRCILQHENIDPEDFKRSICGQNAINAVNSSEKSDCKKLIFFPHDKRFLMKPLRKSEMKICLDMLSNYYAHIKKYGGSLIARLCGLHVLKHAGGDKAYFAVFSNLVSLDVCIHECYNLKGSRKGRNDHKKMVHNKPMHNDRDFNLTFYIDPMYRARLLAQLKYDCEFLEAEGLMNYNLLLAIHWRDLNEDGSVDARSSGSGESINDASEGTADTESVNELTLTDICCYLDRPGLKLGHKVPVRTVNAKKNEPESLPLHKLAKPMERQNADVYLGIVDTLQHYSMTKRIEHAYMSLQYDSKSIPAVNPKAYSSRFQKFVSNIFQEEKSKD